MIIELKKKDVADIANKVKAGGGNFSDLEVALAKKCLNLYERLGEINNQRNEFFDAIYSASIKFEKATKGALKHKRAAYLASMSKAHFAAAVKLDNELKKVMDNETKEAI